MARTEWSGDDTARILVLEDDSTLREVLSELLEDEGYLVEVAAGGDEALSQVSRTRFDLLIFDIRMEGMDGLETLGRMLARGVSFPSLAITGFAGDDDPVRALRLGVGDYLRKPFRPDQLLDSVSRLLWRHRHEVQTRASLAGLRRLAVWAGQALGGEEPGRLVERIDQLAQAAELVPSQASEVVLAGLVWGLRPDALRSPNAPERIALWEAALESGFDRDVPLEAQVLSLARASLQAPPGENLAQAVSRLHPGRFDPILLGSLDLLQIQDDNPDARRWLSLARGLLAQGQVDQARLALQRILALSAAQEGVDACMILAELPGSAQADSLHWLRRAVDQARQLGPATAARTTQWAALLLLRWEAPEAPAALRQAQARLHQLGLEAEAAVVELALGENLAAALERLLRPENEPYLAAELETLFPRIREQAPEKLLRRLLLRYPQLARRHGYAAPVEVAAEARPALRVIAFGGLQLFWGGKPVEESLWRGPLVKYLFAFLARQGGRPVHEGQILEAFWPEGHENSRRRLSGALSALRRTLLQATGLTGDPILRSRDRYSFSPEWEIWHDLSEFEQARSQAESGAGRERLPHWTRMQLLYAGPYLEGCYLDWALLERQRLEEQLVQSLIQTATTTLETEPERALEAAQRALGLEPYLQSAHLALMRAQVRLAQPEKAVAHYERLVPLLHRELALEPTLELVEAYHRARLALP